MLLRMVSVSIFLQKDAHRNNGNEDVVDFKPALGVKHKPKEGIGVNMDDVKIASDYDYYNFWITAFHDANKIILGGLVKQTEHIVLEYLTDITVALFEFVNTGFALNFYPQMNPFFANKQLDEAIENFHNLYNYEYQIDRCGVEAKYSLEDRIDVDRGLDNYDGYVTANKIPPDRSCVEQDMKSQVSMSSAKAEFVLEPVLVDVCAKDVLHRDRFPPYLVVSIKNENYDQAVEEFIFCLEKLKDKTHSHYSQFDPIGNRERVQDIFRAFTGARLLRSGPQFSGDTVLGLVPNWPTLHRLGWTTVKACTVVELEYKFKEGQGSQKQPHLDI